MANNAILIEAGAPVGGNLDDFRDVVKGVRATVEGLASEGLIEAHRFYVPVTGNRTERSMMLILECTHEQLEPLVVSRPYLDILSTFMGRFPNFTTHRMVFGDILDRIQDDG